MTADRRSFLQRLLVTPMAAKIAAKEIPKQFGSKGIPPIGALTDWVVNTPSEAIPAPGVSKILYQKRDELETAYREFMQFLSPRRLAARRSRYGIPPHIACMRSWSPSYKMLATLHEQRYYDLLEDEFRQEQRTILEKFEESLGLPKRTQLETSPAYGQYNIPDQEDYS